MKNEHPRHPPLYDVHVAFPHGPARPWSLTVEIDSRFVVNPVAVPIFLKGKDFVCYCFRTYGYTAKEASESVMMYVAQLWNFMFPQGYVGRTHEVVDGPGGKRFHQPIRVGPTATPYVVNSYPYIPQNEEAIDAE